MPALETPTAIDALAEFRRVIFPHNFRYIDLREAVPLHYCAFGCGGWLLVIGHPEDGSYEWVAKHSRGFYAEDLPEVRSSYEWSNEGWGGVVSCLREGLVAMADWY